MNQGMQMLSYLISGIALYGLLGWAGDHVLGTAFLLPVGIVVGAGLGIYLVIRRSEQAAAGAGPPGTGTPGTGTPETGTGATTRTGTTSTTGTTGTTTEGNT